MAQRQGLKVDALYTRFARVDENGFVRLPASCLATVCALQQLQTAALPGDYVKSTSADEVSSPSKQNGVSQEHAHRLRASDFGTYVRGNVRVVSQ